MNYSEDNLRFTQKASLQHYQMIRMMEEMAEEAYIRPEEWRWGQLSNYLVFSIHLLNLRERDQWINILLIPQNNIGGRLDAEGNATWRYYSNRGPDLDSPWLHAVAVIYGEAARGGEIGSNLRGNRWMPWYRRLALASSIRPHPSIRDAYQEIVEADGSATLLSPRNLLHLLSEEPLETTPRPR